MSFSKKIVQWYIRNKRDLPWRINKNPYAVWLSEIILQQTRVAQGLPYFEAFINKFPTVFHLANATEEEVLKTWQGLGYYSRARNLHKTAQFIAFEKNGVFPSTYDELLQLKGVGSYTAAAIASICYEEKVPVVDGNVFRVLARIFDIKLDISLPATKLYFFEMAKNLMLEEKPSLFNQALMEFGALQCVPKNPKCEICIFSSSCMAYNKQLVSTLPIKNKKQTIEKKIFNYLVFLDKNKNTIIKKRENNGIWKNLYEFPLLETKNIVNHKEISLLLEKENVYARTIISIENFLINPIVHKLSHQHLTIIFWKVTVDNFDVEPISCVDLKKFPFPIVIYKFLEKYIF